MNEHPLLFSAPMIRAILEDRKTVTRRMSKRPDHYMGWKKGDRIWVREAFSIQPCNRCVRYKADDNILHVQECWKPSIHMPRWASRIALELTADVRQELLQDMSENQANREGVDKEFRVSIAQIGYKDYSIPNSYKGGFVNIWNNLHADHPWESNPIVSVIEFKRIKP